jgi:hypothetical protein
MASGFLVPSESIKQAHSLVHQTLNCAVFIRVNFLSQQGALSAKYGSIASEKQRSCGEKETEEIWRNLGVGALVM